MARARTFLNLLLLVALLAGLGFAVYWGWHGWQAFGGYLIPRWRAYLADPILRLLIRALDLAGGDLLLFFAMVALATWVLSRTLGTVATWGAATSSRLPRTALENAVASVEDVQGRLRSLFADDVEKIAFYESRLGTRGGRGRSMTRSQLIGCGGCLFSLLWTLFSLPASMLINVAVFEGVLRLFGGWGDLRQLEAAAGPLAEVLRSHLPPPTHYLGIALQERSALLTLLLLVTGLLSWLVLNIPPTGRTLPAVKPPGLWLALVPTVILVYLVLNGLLLLWTLITAVVWVFDALWRKIWRGLYLRLRAIVLRWRPRPEIDRPSEPASPAMP